MPLTRLKWVFCNPAGNLHERDIRAATATWEVLLLILSKNSTWSTAIDVQKTLLPKFMSFLKNAGFGTAASIHPLVVVLIDKLPEKSPEILDSCVAALIHGLSVENVRHTDTIAICRAICDIFNYIGKKHLDLSAECVDRHFSPLVENSLLGSSNAIRGIDLLLRVLLNWLTGGKGDICRVCARKVFRGMADKVMYLAPNDLAGVRVQQWITGLVEAGKSVQSGRDGSTRSRVIEEEVDLQVIAVSAVLVYLLTVCLGPFIPYPSVVLSSLQKQQRPGSRQNLLDLHPLYFRSASHVSSEDLPGRLTD